MSVFSSNGAITARRVAELVGRPGPQMTVAMATGYALLMTPSNTPWLHSAIALIEADYLPSYHDAAWVQQQLGDCAESLERINAQLA